VIYNPVGDKNNEQPAALKASMLFSYGVIKKNLCEEVAARTYRLSHFYGEHSLSFKIYI
jgi:hypothetical protein